ncbi:hypothetical protein [Microbulbifer magnicolonia]|uniref:hypothetical protein n=1 Tax=Microbulbifer magnicolonia TaxID=3109744 RepID=UPI002B411593|nr:hypothetical protein [Microbulbifer sp. GG15]
MEWLKHGIGLGTVLFYCLPLFSAESFAAEKVAPWNIGQTEKIIVPLYPARINLTGALPCTSPALSTAAISK